MEIPLPNRRDEDRELSRCSTEMELPMIPQDTLKNMDNSSLLTLSLSPIPLEIEISDPVLTSHLQ